MKKLILCFLLCFSMADISLAGVTVIGKLTQERTLEPGDSYEGVIYLKNNGSQNEQVKIFQTDYSFTADGHTDYGTLSSIDRSNGGWITVSPSRITIPPKEDVSIYYTVTVPGEESLKGTYWSVIMIEPYTDSSAEVPQEETGKIKLGVATIIRYAIQIVTNIGPAGVSDMKVISERVSNSDGKTYLQTDIENTGERWLCPSAWVELYDAKGTMIGRIESRALRIYPECSVRYHFDLTNIPNGLYTALLIFDNGDENVFGANYNLTLQ